MTTRKEEDEESMKRAEIARKSRRESMQKYVASISTSELIALEKNDIEKNLLMLYRVRQLREEINLLMNLLEK